MTTSSNHKRSTLLSALALGAAVLMGAPAAQANGALLEDAQLVELARTATTPQLHAQVAKQYRLRAETLEAAAAKLEASAARAVAARPPITHKFPSAFGTSSEGERQRAVQTRQAAQQARTLAQWHLSRAVELFFGQ